MVSNTKLVYEFTQKGIGPDKWNLTLLELNSSNHSLQIKNVSFKVGDYISKLILFTPLLMIKEARKDILMSIVPFFRSMTYQEE